MTAQCVLTREYDQAMSDRIAGTKARELLDGTTEGPMKARYRDDDLLAAAPALAETVAWLYGREPDLVEKDGRAEWDMTAHHEVVAVDGEVLDMDGRSHTPEDAVEYARALLAAAEAAKQS